MPISLTCSECGKRLKARDELAGKSLPCPNCGKKVTVPEAEESIAGYLLQDEQPSQASPPPALRPPASEEDEPMVARRQPSPPVAKTRKTDLTMLPPLTMNEPPLWLRHLHWLLVLALLPLAFSLLNHDDQEDLQDRLAKTLEASPPDVQVRFLKLQAKAEATKNDDEEGGLTDDELLAILPQHKLLGALLPRNSFAHWGFAAGSALLFMTFFLLLASQKTAEPLTLLGLGAFTATIGILLLLFLQTLANWSQGIWLRGGSIVVVIFYIVKFIGFSYQAALDPNSNFFLSFMGYTLGVGFCEEVCKALPLLWHYHNNPGSQRWRTAFLWGLASGAGFGISEGIMYSSRHYNGISGLDTYVVRFISCVALHALWTGSVAITINQKEGLLHDVESWYEYIPRLYLIVGVPMILHGLYDTLLKKDMNAIALGVAVLSFLFLAFQISRLHGDDDEEARKAMLREYKRRRAAMS